MRTKVIVKEDGESEPVLTLDIRRPRIEVIDRHQNSVGFFKSKLFSLGGGFSVHSPSGDQIADIQGNWKGWDFKLIDMNGNELGKVNKKWAGMKDYGPVDNFQRGFRYMKTLIKNSGLAALLLAASIAHRYRLQRIQISRIQLDYSKI